jgi:hypothetical protein
LIQKVFNSRFSDLFLTIGWFRLDFLLCRLNDIIVIIIIIIQVEMHSGHRGYGKRVLNWLYDLDLRLDLNLLVEEINELELLCFLIHAYLNLLAVSVTLYQIPSNILRGVL